jgi:hypothetical protein
MLATIMALSIITQPSPSGKSPTLHGRQQGCPPKRIITIRQDDWLSRRQSGARWTRAVAGEEPQPCELACAAILPEVGAVEDEGRS